MPKYILEFKTTPFTSVRIENLKMTDLMNKIKELLKQYYFLDDTMYKLNNDIIHNILYNRSTNKLFKHIITIERIPI
jgi:formylmethanofuran dehydrogenase subunit A